MNVLIFEDIASNADELVYLINKHAPFWKIIGIGNTIDQCRLLLNEPNCDIIFSDIHFGEEVIFKVIPELGQFTGQIVFVTGDNNFATQAFEICAVDYILKPINELAFLRILEKVQKPNSNENMKARELLVSNLQIKDNNNKKISFYTKKGYLVKKVSEILFFKADGNYTEAYFTNKEKIMVAKTILHFEKLLVDCDFMRVHQSYVINLNEIQLFNKEGNYIIMNQGFEILVSLRKKGYLLEKLQNIF